MGSFSASLKTLGDRRGLPATIHLEDGRLRIAAGEQPIGDWSLDEIHLEPTPNGYRMAAEGDQILLEIPEAEAFGAELDQKRPKVRRLRKEKSPRKGQPKTEKPRERRAKAEKEPRERRAKAEKEPRERKLKTEKPARERGPFGERVVTTVDGWLERAEKRWGALLPQWVFTRMMFWAAVAFLILTIFLPGLVATLLLLAVMVAVVFGAIVYTDQVLAAKWLPGRMSPMHVLVIGVVVVLLGVLLAVIAN